MALIEIKEDTAKKLRIMKAKNNLKSYDDCIQELFCFWEVMP